MVLKNKPDKKDFFTRVYEIVAVIPEGKVTTYGAIANRLGIGGSARMVGWALNHAIDLEDSHLPCHRVVNRLGQLSGKAYFGPGVMRALLEAEDVSFKDEDTVDIKKHFWQP